MTHRRESVRRDDGARCRPVVLVHRSTSPVRHRSRASTSGRPSHSARSGSGRSSAIAVTARRAAARARSLSCGRVLGQQRAQDGAGGPLQRQRAEALGEQAGPAQDVAAASVGRPASTWAHPEEQQALGHVARRAGLLGEVDRRRARTPRPPRPCPRAGRPRPAPSPAGPAGATSRRGRRRARSPRPGGRPRPRRRPARPRRRPGRGARRSPPPRCRPSPPARARRSPGPPRAARAGGARWPAVALASAPRTGSRRCPSPATSGSRTSSAPPYRPAEARQTPSSQPAAGGLGGQAARQRPASTARRSGSTPAAGRPWNAARSPAASSPGEVVRHACPSLAVRRQSSAGVRPRGYRAPPDRDGRLRTAATTVSTAPGRSASQVVAGRHPVERPSQGRRAGPRGGAAPRPAARSAVGADPEPVGALGPEEDAERAGARDRVGQRPGGQPDAQQARRHPPLRQRGGQRDQRQPVVLRLERREQQRPRGARAGPAAGTARSADSAHSLSRCSTSTPDPVLRQRSPIPVRTGTSSVVPGRARRRCGRRRAPQQRVQASPSSAIAARASPRAAGTGVAQRHHPAAPGPAGPPGGGSRLRGGSGGQRVVGARQVGRAGRRRRGRRVGRGDALHHQPAHQGQPGQVGGGVPPTGARLVRARAQAVPPVPGPQRPGRDPQPAGDGRHAQGHRGRRPSARSAGRVADRACRRLWPVPRRRARARLPVRGGRAGSGGAVIAGVGSSL